MELFLLTRNGERHEDHIPIGVYDHETLRNWFSIQEEKNSLSDGEWHEVNAIYGGEKTVLYVVRIVPNRAFTRT